MAVAPAQRMFLALRDPQWHTPIVVRTDHMALPHGRSLPRFRGTSFGVNTKMSEFVHLNVGLQPT
jgi:hypothetical protein